MERSGAARVRRPRVGVLDERSAAGRAPVRPLLRGELEPPSPRQWALLALAYGLALGAMFVWQGSWLSPDRHLLVLLVPAGCIGRGRRFLVDFVPFVALYFAYEELRGVAHLLSPSPFYRPQLDVDRAIFAGHLPTAWLQGVLWDGGGGSHRLGQALADVTHLHTVTPMALLAAIWLVDRHLYWRCAATLLAVSFAAAASFWLFPAAPPWMAARAHVVHGVLHIDQHGAVDPALQPTALVTGSSPDGASPIVRHLLPNDAAAVPSLHAAYAVLVVLFAWQLSRRLGLLALAYPVVMTVAVVFLGEHYVSDALAGYAFAILGWIGVNAGARRLWSRFPPQPARSTRDVRA